MPRRVKQFPETSDLREYLPALRQARVALRERRRRMERSFEPQGLRQVERAEQELEELVETLTPEDSRAS